MEMVFLLLVGAVVYKTGIIDAAANKKVSNFLLMVISPALIISSYQMEYDVRLLQELLMTFALSAVSFAATILFCKIVLHSKAGVDSPVEKMAVIYSNCGFIGIPLINGILGAEGVFCMTAYTTVFNVLVWTHGVILMSGGGEKVRMRDMWKNLVTPAMIAVVIGITLFLTGVQLPAVIGNPISSVGDMNTPIAMIVAGINLAQGNLPGQPAEGAGILRQLPEADCGTGDHGAAAVLPVLRLQCVHDHLCGLRLPGGSHGNHVLPCAITGTAITPQSSLPCPPFFPW